MLLQLLHLWVPSLLEFRLHYFFKVLQPLYLFLLRNDFSLFLSFIGRQNLNVANLSFGRMFDELHFRGL